MRKFLLVTTAIVSFAAQVEFARAADVEPGYNLDFPSSFISFEGGIFFDASPSNISFDEDSLKLGDLNPLHPGDWGGQGRFELGQRLNSDWDYKVGVSAVFLSEDSSSGDQAEAHQKTSLQTVDLEIGYIPQDIGGVKTRVFGGLRGLHSASEAGWSTDVPFRKATGEFDDDVYAIGPRIGVDILVPLPAANVSLIGAASGSALLGNMESSYTYDGADFELTHWSDSRTIWNIDAMVGVSFGVGDDADLTIGYRAAQFSGLVADRSDIETNGEFSRDGTSDLLVHGPFARLTVEIP
jgi:opacity protein-like surface antigen